MSKICKFCDKDNLRKYSDFCSTSCKNKNWYKNNKEKLAKKYLENRDNILLYKKDFYNENKNVILKRNKAWKIKNKKWVRDYHNNRDFSIEERLRNSLRSRISAAIRGNYKSGSAVDDLGCSVEELKKHLESQFTGEMSWNNYGRDGWHIDHIKPLASFDLTKEYEFKEACHYTNLQPLWQEDNLKKGAKSVI